MIYNPLEEYEKKFLLSFEPMERLLRQYEKNGYTEFRNDRWSLTETGMFLSNQIIYYLQEAQEKAQPLPGRI